VRLLADVNISRHVAARLKEEGHGIALVPGILVGQHPQDAANTVNTTLGSGLAILDG
jgi:hypothetical protein